MKYGLLTYARSTPYINIGDYIQSLAAKQFLPKVDCYINREKLADYKGDKTKIILNGWFAHNIINWIPSPEIEPLFISFHINKSAAPFILDQKGVNYLKKHEPIGCRDYYTVKILKEKSIKAYFSGCLTLTLDSYKENEQKRTNEIYIVDLLYNYPTLEKVTKNFKSFIRSVQRGTIFKLRKRMKHISKLIDEDLLKRATYINQEYPSTVPSEEGMFNVAEGLLRKYARAKLVITSRIHCALPCLALGTPVIFVNGFEDSVDTCRFEGILDLFNRIDINMKNGKYEANFNLESKISGDLQILNSNDYITIAEELKSKCESFIKIK